MHVWQGYLCCCSAHRAEKKDKSYVCPIAVGNFYSGNSIRNIITLERAIKWKFLLPILLLWKPHLAMGTNIRDLKPTVGRQLAMYAKGNLARLIADLDTDTMVARSIHCVDIRTLDEVDEAKLRKTCELFSRFQCSKALKLMQSNSLGDHHDHATVDQMWDNHPQRKLTIFPLMDKEMSHPRKEVDGNILRTRLH